MTIVFWILVGAVALAGAVAVNSCQEDECRQRGGRVASGYANGHYVSLCIEPEQNR